MANIDLYPIQDNYESKLSQPYDGTSSTIFVDSIPLATLPVGVKVLFTINPGTSFAQTVEVNGWSAGQLNVSSTTIEKANGVNYTPVSHGAKSPIIISDNFGFWKEITEAVNSKAELASPVFTGSVGLPTYVDATARDVAIPSPTGKELIKMSGDVRHYNLNTAQREELDVGTPSPNASDTAKGVVEMSNPAQVTAGTSVGETGARLVVGPSELKTVTDGLTTSITGASKPEALFEKNQYLAGESLLANDSLFTEVGPTFTESTTVQNIGDITANTRVSFLAIGSGVATNTLKLSLRKTLSPSANLLVRIETVSGGNPTGTLVNANATATVTAASITTSLVDTTITLAGSITIPKGQQVAIVVSAVGDVVNATNFYGVGITANNTTTRPARLWNGSSWSSITYSNVNNSVAVGGSQGNFDGFMVYTFKPKFTCLFVSQSAAYTVTGPGLSTTSLTPNIILSKGIIYTVTFDPVGITTWFNGSYSNNDLEIVSNSSSWVAHTIVTQRIDETFGYVSSTLFENTLLSKTSALFSYKLPTDYVRLATQAYSVGQSVTSTYYGLTTYPGLVDNTIYYIANTAGLISAVSGTNSCVVGKNTFLNKMLINKKLIDFPITVGVSPFSFRNNTTNPIQIRTTGGTVSNITTKGVSVATATNNITTIANGETIIVTYTVLPTMVYSEL